MATPAVLSTSPANNATDVTIDAPVQFVFNTDLDTNTIGLATVYVFDPDTSDTIRGVVSYDAASKTITFLARQALLQNHAYSAVVVGLSDGLGSYIAATDGTPLPDTFRIDFRTTEERYVPLEEVADRDDIELVGPVRAVEAILPPQLQALAGVLSVSISTSDPEAFESEVDVCLSTIEIETTPPLIDQDTSAIELLAFPALGDEDYLADTDTAGVIWLNDINCLPTGEYDVTTPTGVLTGILPPDFVNPTGVFTITGGKLVWQRGVDEPCFMYNQELHVVLPKGLLGVTDAGVTGEFTADSSVVFTTEYWPKFIDHRLLRIELGPVAADLLDDTLNRIIHKNSIEAWEISAGCFDIDNPYPAVKRYVKWASILNVFDTLTLRAGLLGGGENKTLGDFEYERTLRGNIQNAHPMYAKAKEELKRWTLELRRYRGQNDVQVTVRGINNPTTRQDYFHRTWDNWCNWTWEGVWAVGSQVIPAGNQALERAIKLSNSHDHKGIQGVYGNRPPGALRSLFKCRQPKKDR